jgi:hypothetical protein
MAPFSLGKRSHLKILGGSSSCYLTIVQRGVCAPLGSAYKYFAYNAYMTDSSSQDPQARRREQVRLAQRRRRESTLGQRSNIEHPVITHQGDIITVEPSANGG